MDKIHPRLRKSALGSLRHFVADAMFTTIESKMAEASFPFQNCLMCDHFDEKNELCRIAKQRPPARVIAFGCASFADQDYIPF